MRRAATLALCFGLSACSTSAGSIAIQPSDGKDDAASAVRFELTQALPERVLDVACLSGRACAFELALHLDALIAPRVEGTRVADVHVDLGGEQVEFAYWKTADAPITEGWTLEGAPSDRFGITLDEAERPSIYLRAASAEHVMLTVSSALADEMDLELSAAATWR